MKRIALLACLELLAGCAATLLPDAGVPTGDAKIYVVGRGWHTDIGLPVDEVNGPLATLGHDFPGISFMVFGFGERAYYMAQRDGSGEMLAAMFPSKSAVLLTALSAPPDRAFADQQVVPVHLTQKAVDHIADSIWQDLEKNAAGVPVRLAEGPYPGSIFLASTETYDAFHTCNTWTAALLRGAGFPVDTDVLFADQVMQQARQIAASQARH